MCTKQTKKRVDSTDVPLLVNTETKDRTFPWDKERLQRLWKRKPTCPEEVSGEIAGAVEQGFFSSGLNRISTALIRELVDNELFEKGFNKKLEKQQVIGMPKYDLEELIMSKNKENGNISARAQPWAIGLAVSREYTEAVCPSGGIFKGSGECPHERDGTHSRPGLSDAGILFFHSLEYLKEYGLSSEIWIQNLLGKSCLSRT